MNVVLLRWPANVSPAQDKRFFEKFRSVVRDLLPRDGRGGQPPKRLTVDVCKRTRDEHFQFDQWTADDAMRYRGLVGVLSQESALRLRTAWSEIVRASAKQAQCQLAADQAGSYTVLDESAESVRRVAPLLEAQDGTAAGVLGLFLNDKLNALVADARLYLGPRRTVVQRTARSRRNFVVARGGLTHTAPRRRGQKRKSAAAPTESRLWR